MTTSNKSLRLLVEWMREQRRQAGMTYRDLSSRTRCHATTLQRAASGESMPKLGTVLAYARSCDASPETAKSLWKQARYEETRLRSGQRLPAPRPELIRDFADLGIALEELYRRAGSPPFRSMEERAGGYGALPRSTARRIVNRQALPHSVEQFQAFLHVCELPEREQAAWLGAWSRVWRLEKQDAAETAGAIASEWFEPPQQTLEVKTGEWFSVAPRDSGRARATQRPLVRFTEAGNGSNTVLLDVQPMFSEQARSHYG
ncbi:helix-turn-helix domain-containing protein [Streptomyces sp. NPDC050848]|uniref:helix-turn-helix domain-containing protein n=1 Tax=Streptomyces sp. NPDC050848 TaxID=3155791 RepID=UPI0033DD3B8D